MKLAKLSLAALMAAGVVSTANAGTSVEEAIKGVNIGGFMRYRHNTTNNSKDSGSADTDQNEFKGALVANVPVAEDLKFQIGFLTILNGTAGISDTTGDEVYTEDDQNFRVNKFNFTYTGFANTALTAGYQSMVSPFFDAGDDRGAGLRVNYNAGVANITAAHFTDVSGHDGTVDSDNDHEIIGISGKAGIVALNAWYMNVDGQDDSNATTESYDGSDAYSLQAKATIEGITVDGMYTKADPDSTDNDNALYKIMVSGKVANVGLTGGYIGTDNEGGVVTRGDSDAKVGFKVLQFQAGDDNHDYINLDAWYLAASMPLMDKVTGKVQYVGGQYDESIDGEERDADELRLLVKYQMYKNFYILGFWSRFERAEEGDSSFADNDYTRLEAKYTF